MAARARSGGDGSGYAVALTIFVALFVISTITAIVCSTKIGTAQEAAQKADGEIKQFITNAQRSDPNISEVIAQARSERGQSVIGYLMANTADLDAKLAESSRLAVKLQAELQASQTEINRLKQQIIDTDARRADAQSERDLQTQAYQDKYDALLAQVQTLESDTSDYRKQSDQAAADVKDQFADLRSALNSDLAEKENTVANLDGQLSQLKRKIEELEQGRTREDVIDPSLLPDGIIVSIPNERNLVFVNLNRSNQIMLGQTFEVYDDPEGIVRNKYNELVGKATIEIVRIGENASLARIVEMERGAIVSEGNFIANLVYDPEMTFKFKVFGEFDIDDIGKSTTRDRNRVETMIRNWDGHLVAELTYDTDFLILGTQPMQPTPLSDDEFDPVKIKIWQEKIKKLRQYNSLVDEAKALKIPVLNQNRFLTMIGYYHR